jgi:PTH1 family peptidyl-tRNA hydrolase
MNNSGIAVSSIVRFYKIKIHDIWIVCDDINLPIGKLRIREKGSSGGHNGIKSIISHLGRNDFPRFRIGVGPLPKGADTSAYVLGAFKKKEETVIDEIISKTAKSITYALEHGIKNTMDMFN